MKKTNVIAKKNVIARSASQRRPIPIIPIMLGRPKALMGRSNPKIDEIASPPSGARNDKLAIVVSQFNRHITEKLLNQCTLELVRQGIPRKNIRVIWVPGAYELPFVAQRLARIKRPSAVICLGCIIKGGTDHDAHIARWVSVGLGQASLNTNVPIFFGVLTTKTESQALARSRPGPMNRGKEMALAAVELLRTLKKEKI